VKFADAVVRVKSAKTLRAAYVALNQAPDGADPDPLTVPRCVECGHCGWPVYPRDAKVATKKTFARAGIERGTKAEEDAKRKEQEKDKGDENGSVDSRDTVERMADEIDDLKDANKDLEERNQTLDAQNEALTKELAETKEALAAAEERIEFLEEAEMRWRDKLSQARLEIDRLKQVLDRASSIAADREAGLIKTILELRALRQKHEAFVRRRNFMLQRLDKRLENKENEDHKGSVLRLWRTQAVNDKLTTSLQDLELRRQREVKDLMVQLRSERDQVQNLRTQKEQLQARLKQAGYRLLQRTLAPDAWPSAKDHAFRALVGMHPVNALENALEFCQAELERVNSELEVMTERAENLEEERDKLRTERDTLSEDNRALKAELDWLKDQIGGSLEEMEAKRREQEELHRRHLAELEAWRKKLEDLEAAFAEERAALETQIRMLEGRLALAESAAAGGDEDGADDDPSRVAPKGQGVLCVGCLKQLVHRAVKPLPPMGALMETNERLEKAKKKFFEKELQGAADASDPLHTHAFKSRRDPYGVNRLTLQPPGAITAPQSPSWPNLQSPTTGLPALKKKCQLANSATALRASMKEFKPRNFR